MVNESGEKSRPYQQQANRSCRGGLYARPPSAMLSLFRAGINPGPTKKIMSFSLREDNEGRPV